jgi:molybdenum cofactor synthesis domain-containing protein
MPDPVQTAALISIGDELLRGDTVDTNKAFLAKELAARGVAVKYGLTLPDDPAVIVRELRRILPDFDVVFTGGGIGPTPDDLTRQAVAAAFGRELVVVAAAAERYSRMTGQPLNPGQMAMCTLPAGCEVLYCDESAAPFFRLEHVYVLPGVPKIMHWMWASIADRFSGTPLHVARFRAAGRESQYAALMGEFAARHPQLQFGSYPKADESGWWAEITVRGVDAAEVDRAAAEFEQGIRDLA